MYPFWFSELNVIRGPIQPIIAHVYKTVVFCGEAELFCAQKIFYEKERINVMSMKPSLFEGNLSRKELVI